MAEIIPFKALEFNSDLQSQLNKLICPPYDVISEKEQLEYYKEHKNNIIRLEMPLGNFGYSHAFNTLERWKKEKILIKEQQDSLYLYEQEFCFNGKTKKTTGVICLVKLEDFSKKVILPHENTLASPRLDRFNLLKSTFCNFNPIYSLYSDKTLQTKKRIEPFLNNKPDMEALDKDGVTHRIFKIRDPEIIAKICDDFKNRKLFIADGHHRYETALEFKKFCADNNIVSNNGLLDYTLMFLVNARNTDLAIFPTHRIIHDLKDFSLKKFIKKCKKYFYVSEKQNILEVKSSLEYHFKRNENVFALYTGNNSWYILTLKNKELIKKEMPKNPRVLRSLDVTVLHFIVLGKILKTDCKSNFCDKNLIYTRNINKAIRLVDKKEAKCAFILNPTTISQIIQVAYAKEKMPQKSTYFYPKAISGFLINEL